MKKGLLGSTALIGATALMAGTAGAAEAPTWKLTGNVNFQAYYVDQDLTVISVLTTLGTTILTNDLQDDALYFGVDEAELQLNVSGTADNGLNYGFKVELQVNTDDGDNADEARLQLSGGWGTLQMGDEDGAEDTMNYGGENLMGATGGFDGDYDDVITVLFGAPSYPTIAGDTSDATKVTYYSPRFSGFQVGASWTPNPEAKGDKSPQEDGWFENHIGLGANYDNSFGNVRVRASAVYSTASFVPTMNPLFAPLEDVSAWSVGGIVGFGPASIGANYTDNGDSGGFAGVESSYWNVAASFETGPIYLSAGYMSSVLELGGGFENTWDMISLTADYTVAPGLSVYAELDLGSDDLLGVLANDSTIFIAGANVSF